MKKLFNETTIAVVCGIGLLWLLIAGIVFGIRLFNPQYEETTEIITDRSSEVECFINRNQEIRCITRYYLHFGDELYEIDEESFRTVLFLDEIKVKR
jgi:hypothetical protein